MGGDEIHIKIQSKYKFGTIEDDPWYFWPIIFNDPHMVAMWNCEYEVL
jgi:hypothetical protein